MLLGNRVARLAAVLALSLAFTFSACKTAQKKDGGSEINSPTDSVAETALGDSDSGRAAGMKSINFPYDSFSLTAEAKATLAANAQIMKDRASVRVQIEGHCDQRGGIQYNIALGEKRANAVKGYLADMGVAADRLTTISYGKERPLDPAMTEAAMAQNRRANFVITAQ